MDDDFDSNPLRKAFIDGWRSSLDRHLVEDAGALVKSATVALGDGRKAEAGRLARAALLTAVVAIEACVTDSLEIANEWAAEPLVDDYPPFGPSLETRSYLKRRLKGTMNFEDKLFLGFDAIFGECPFSTETVETIRTARRLRNKLAHLRSLRNHADHEVLFDPQRVVAAAEKVVRATNVILEEMDEFFRERWELPRSVYTGDEDEEEEEEESDDEEE
jgi:hypothetical protein